MEAYLDNAATTKVSKMVKDIMVEALELNYGNPSSMHKLGIDAEKYMRSSKDLIAKLLKVEPKEIVFTSGGTEANNMALFGVALANARAGKHIITTQFEHPSVHNPLLALKDMGFRLSFVSVDSNGKVKEEELISLIEEDTILVSIMYANNEIGAVQDIKRLSALVKEKKPTVLFHTDAIQAFGKFPIFPKKEGIDLMSVSGHKFHGPKGSGFLYIKDKVKIKPLLYGGGQQKGFRSGTENVPAIAGIGMAVSETYEGQKEKMDMLFELKQYFTQKVLILPEVSVNAIFEDKREELSLRDRIRMTAPHVVSVSIAGIRSEVLLHALEDKGVYVSSGSACASNHPGLSGSLTAIGVEKELVNSTVRFSFSINTTREEVDYALVVLNELVPMLRKYTRK